jgi:hypothetical protein
MRGSGRGGGEIRRKASCSPTRDKIQIIHHGRELLPVSHSATCDATLPTQWLQKQRLSGVMTLLKIECLGGLPGLPGEFVIRAFFEHPVAVVQYMHCSKIDLFRGMYLSADK